MLWNPIRSRHWWVRAGWLAGVLLASALVLWLAAVVSDLPPGYGPKQYASAAELARRPTEWDALRRGTVRDISRYVPVYLVWGVAVAATVGAAKSKKAGGMIAGAVAATAAADVVETVLFRSSLTRLIDSNGTRAIGSLVRATQVFTTLKVVSALAALAMLFFHVLAGPGGSAAHPAGDGG